MKVSYAVTVCDEFIEIQRLLNHLLEYKKPQDEIVVLYDNNGTKEVFNYLQSVEGIKLVWDNFDGHFADWKNKLNFVPAISYSKSMLMSIFPKSLSTYFIKYLKLTPKLICIMFLGLIP
jgi:hypothetical protein